MTYLVQPLNLNKLKYLALTNRSAIGYISANEVSLELLCAWLMNNANAEFLVVPISNQFPKREASAGIYNKLQRK
jgi:hypothetical protein